MAVHEDDAVKAPTHLDAIEAATLPVSAVTSWHSLFVYGKIRLGGIVLVQGAGGISTSAIQFAAAAGARVISLLRSDTAVKKLTAIGAHDVVLGGDRADWPARVRATR
jgi:NADPH:quinone reductase-like Zn-dependent oxidoreductase